MYPANDGAPRFLIDLSDDGEVIPTEDSESYDYVALSYHRQGANGVRLNQEQKLRLLACRSLRQQDMLPPIVRQTMELVREIGHRYLWVDFLCLAHCADDVVAEMRHMDKIYAGAQFTIIAAYETGLYDCASQRSQTGPDDDQVSQIRSANSKRSYADDPMVYNYQELLKSTWAKRGWTYQERMYSKRAIIFAPRSRGGDQRQEQTLNDTTKQSFFWECECNMRDDWDLTIPISTAISEKFRVVADPKRQRWDATTEQRLHFARYLATVYFYNNRDFNYPQDVFRAFSGCLRKLSDDFSDSFQNGFVCGLPRHMLHESLLWQPLGPAIERKCNCNTNEESPHQDLPSWSWCGWQCELDMESLHADQREVLSEESQPPSWGIRSPVHWEVRDTDKELMPGEELPAPSQVEDKISGWPYLACQTHNATLFVRKLHTPTRAPSVRKALCVRAAPANFHRKPTRQVVSLADASGAWAGVLGLMSEAKDDSFPCGRKIQLIAISEGIVRYDELRRSHEEKVDCDASASKRQPEPDRNNPLLTRHSRHDLYAFFNVLRVEQEGDHFVRKALGRVDAGVWKRLCEGKSTSRVVLG